MPVERFEIARREAYAGGRDFGAGAYERIDGIAHYAVDPTAPGNAAITDLALAERHDGLVRFSGDVTLLVPAGGGNRALLVEMPNRGNRVLTRLFNRAPFELVPTDEIDPGDGFLMRHGWTLAWCGWQWDAPRGLRMGIDAPQVPAANRAPDGNMQLRIQPDVRTASFPLTDHHVGSVGNHRPIPVGDPENPASRLLVRAHRDADPVEIPRTRWRFARDENGVPIDDNASIWLEGGFEPGRIYDLIYVPRDCPVAGAGLLAMRDLGSFLRRDAASPLAGRVDHAIAEGISQCGRLLRTYLGLGLNVDKAGLPVYDGILVHVAGGRRGEFNQRYGQPSVQPTPAFGHLFPFADAPQTDPWTGRTAGLLDRQREAGGMPKIFYTDTSSEYWRGDASLAHCSIEDGTDAVLPEEVRRYLFASTQHGPGALPFEDISPFGSHGSNWFNVVDYRPLYRAALMNLLDWVRDGTAPPESVYPRLSDGTARTRDAIAARLAAIPGLACPDAEVLPTVRPLDLGALTDRGIGQFPARFTGDAYPCSVAEIDADGNEIGAVRMPDVTVPVATHTGFNVRHPDSGGPGQILEYVGLSLPFARDAAARAEVGDPRPSIAERYGGRDQYLGLVRAAAEALVGQRLLLAEDIELCVEIAGERYDACA